MCNNSGQEGNHFNISLKRYAKIFNRISKKSLRIVAFSKISTTYQ